MTGHAAVQHFSLRAKGWMHIKSLRICFVCEGSVKEYFMRFSYRLLLTVLLFAVGAQSSQAAGVIRGVVSDPLGARVPAAIVTLLSNGITIGKVTTDGTGSFRFSAVNPGLCQLEVVAQGFESFESSTVTVGDTPVDVDVHLQLGALRQDVVVTATGSETPVDETGASVSLFGGGDIEAQNKLDVLEDIRQIPGAQITQTGQRGGIAHLYIRGGESSFNKVLIDGVPANYIGGSFDFAQLSNYSVAGVEVLRGSNSVLYGADALAGVVNVTTQRGSTPSPEIKYSIDGGNFYTMKQAASAGGVLHKLDYFSDFARLDTKGSYTNDFFHNATYAGNFGYALTPTTQLRATVRKTWTGLGTPNGIYLYGIADDSSQKNQNTAVSATLQNQTTSQWHNLLRFGYGQFNQVYRNPTPTGQQDAYGDYLGNMVNIQGANGYKATGQGILDYYGTYPSILALYNARRSVYEQSDYRFYRDWTGTFGFRYEHENGSGLTRDNYSYVMEAHGSIGGRLFVTGGAGIENNTVFGVATSPRISLAYDLRKSANPVFGETRLKANFGKGIEEPSTTQQASEVSALLTPAQRSQFSINPIGPQRSRTFDAGVKQSFRQARTQVELTFFKNDFYDLITYLSPAQLVSVGVSPGVVTALAGYGAYVNASSTSSKGIETQISTDLGHSLRIQANYTYLDAVVTKAFGATSYNPAFPAIAIGAFSPLQGQRPFNRAPHSGSLGLFYIRRQFTGTITGSFAGRRDDSTFLYDQFYGNTMLLPNRNLDAAYQKIDLSGRYALKPSISLYTGVENLFSEHYMGTIGFPAAPFTIRSGVTITLSGEAWNKTH
jgi:iron complex outermembrane receptor protein/vitamin B12 transporter